MSFNESQWDRLMSRRLDEVASDDELLELDRELIRNPDLRLRWEELRQDHQCASAALQAMFSDRPDTDAVAAGIVDRAVVSRASRPSWRSRAHRGWLLVPGAIAAALAALMIPRMETGRTNSHAPAVTMAPAPLPTPSLSVPSPVRRTGINPDLMRTVETTRRSTGRDVLGIVGDDGNVYFIEVDRTRTIRLPSGGAASNELTRM